MVDPAFLSARTLARRTRVRLRDRACGWFGRTGCDGCGEQIDEWFVRDSLPAAVRFVNQVAKLAEAAWHHPDIDIRWNKVTLTLTTHDAGGLTRKDFVLARKFDRL